MHDDGMPSRRGNLSPGPVLIQILFRTAGSQIVFLEDRLKYTPYESGPATRALADIVKRTDEATPDPKLVFAVGTCAIGGNLWRDSYHVVGGIDKVIPVDIYIPGCPPKT